jgi:ABC-type glycerol-3-phosphate transport system permease component
MANPEQVIQSKRRAPAWNRHKTTKLLGRVGIYFAFGVYLSVILAPILWLVVLAFLPAADTVREDIIINPSHANLDGFRNVVLREGYLDAIKNSLIIACGTTGLLLVFSALGAYAFARLQFRMKNAFLISILAIQMLPGVAIAIPFFSLFRTLHLTGTHLSVILAFLAFFMPMAIWILRGFYLGIPIELEKAGLMDGCTRLEVIRYVIAPLVGPGLLTVGLISFIGAWNAFFLPMVLTAGRLKTVAVQTQAFYSEYTLDVSHGAAAGILAAAPVVILALLFSGTLVKQLTKGAIKG